ncbi:MAG: hypothetical protein GWN99_19745 [Gemmatimonadetes bacterium]|uniref:Uncharacterized protein n=1 Tax=Candidatus Kutchimonas denitrificans TaxID=3056748 RepID=A0AAE4ZB51_9BACT|nr:hypothetical protein [Gemmatimonadota bacterium]NIR76438.1 hypothetical protein [Candidatus Kutchimonas denitrificans]NIS03257.1 hypothetical protein [Gemmatimonadota bacterium]NIT69118.1 hypothetical protein [Gemmatimonadota bacterium]NIU54510.1 hypothetical protein [Gemmatimonadota bacterium]
MEARTAQLDKRRKDLSGNRVLNFVLWRVPVILILVAMLWPAVSAELWTVALAWIGAGCTWNALRCKRVHCSIMGPLFLLLAALSGAATLAWLSVDWNYLGLAALIIVAAAFLPELLGKKYFGSEGSAC